MNPLAAVGLLPVVMLIGYALGRTRPLASLSGWAIDEIRFGSRWVSGSKARQAILLTVWAITTPRDAVDAWQHRNDLLPEPTLIRPTWPKASEDEQ